MCGVDRARRVVLGVFVRIVGISHKRIGTGNTQFTIVFGGIWDFPGGRGGLIEKLWEQNL